MRNILYLFIVLLMASCCEKDAGRAAWTSYLHKESLVNQEMTKLEPPAGTLPFTPYVLRLPERRMIVVPFAAQMPPSPYRLRRDAREWQLLLSKKRFAATQLRAELDRCYCQWNNRVELEARRTFSLR